MKQLSTVADILRLIQPNYSNPHALNTKVDDAWEACSTHQFLTEVRQVALGLYRIGIRKGDTVGIISTPSTRWTVCDLAIMASGAVSVPLFANISEENLRFVLTQAQPKVTFLGGSDPWKRYESDPQLYGQAISLDDHQAIFIISSQESTKRGAAAIENHDEGIAPAISEERFSIDALRCRPIPDEMMKIADHQGPLSYADLLLQGEAMGAAMPNLYLELLHKCKPEDLASLIYTSGSTGVPKGAEHTHWSLSSLLHHDIYGWDSKHDRYLSVLPLAHVYARILNLILLSWGIPIYYFNDLKNVGLACREIKPTILVVVPRLLEKVYAKMLATIQQSSFIKRAIGQWAFDLANREEESSWTSLCHPFAEKLVYSHLREALGGQLRVVLSGGAALDPHLYRFFLDIGVPVFEGWGLTEACPVTVNRIGCAKVGTVGIALGDLLVKASESGELLVKGSNVMRGYYKNPEATALTIDQEGWLHTGDTGTIDADGFVKIVGRIKELFKTSTGEMVAPVPIEQALCNNSPFIEMAIVIADKRKFVSCLLVPNPDVLKKLKATQNVSHLTDEEFLNGFYIESEMQKLLNRVNSHLNHWEQIRAYRFLPQELVISRGELTPSMKIVRRIVEAKYQHLIDSMYEKENR